MYENKDNNIVVVASTGSGKTEGAFLWADDSKVFYTLPLQVSINAIYDRIVDKKEGSYGYPTEKTSILHSNAMSYMLKNIRMTKVKIIMEGVKKIITQKMR